ncbi:hypothetical protein U2083_14225, partial [Listeria monocytogenes]|uniref:hypothetical protein n=1 Tax=Listeria monocytogenes TaxID=1639 RepID=UPI002FDC5698
VMLVFIEAVIADILMFKTSLEETKAVPDDTVRYTDPRTKRPVLMKEQRAMWKSHLQDAESMHRDFSRRVKEWKARKLPDGRSRD